MLIFQYHIAQRGKNNTDVLCPIEMKLWEVIHQ